VVGSVIHGERDLGRLAVCKPFRYSENVRILFSVLVIKGSVLAYMDQKGWMD
jgi:hypothetical protein